jgi:hypothetical protein
MLTAELGALDEGSNLFNSLKAMRAACRKFLDQTQFPSHSRARRFGPRFHPLDVEGQAFFTALGELRGVFGIHVGLIAVQHGVDVEDPLATILPAEAQQHNDED